MGGHTPLLPESLRSFPINLILLPVSWSAVLTLDIDIVAHRKGKPWVRSAGYGEGEAESKRSLRRPPSDS